MQFNRTNFSNEELEIIYRALLLPRMIEEKMLVLLRQGKISKWFSGIGQEAIAVGATLALKKEEWIMPLHRNLGVFTTREMPLNKLFKQWQGSIDGYSKGRERSFHFGNKDFHICGMISHLGPQLAIADGVALAHKLRKEEKVSLAFSGEGGTSEGDFHEALNVAAVWNLPVIFLVENNGYGLSTPVNEQYRCNNIVDKAMGFGMKGMKIDGNNVMEVITSVQKAREYAIREQKPVLIEAITFRMRGHEEASGVKYVPKELFDEWWQKDPIKCFQNFLIEESVLTEMQIADIKNNLKEYLDVEIKEGFNSPPLIPNTEDEIRDVYAPSKVNVELLNTDGPSKELKLFGSIKEALHQSMEQHSNLILMGQDIAEYGGAFKITEGFVENFGKERVRNTPLCESAIVGAALGLSLEGYKSVMEMQFADFATVGFNQIVNNLAKIHYRWGQNADVVIRMPTGAGVGAGPFHSQSNEAWFTKVPGLKVVYPSNPIDAKGLLIAAINDPNPVMYFEHKAMYRSISGLVPEKYYEVEIGKAKIVNEGNDFSIITYGYGVQWALEYANAHKELSVEILDLRTLLPLDYESIEATVRKNGKILLLHEDTLISGIGGEIAAWISEHCFNYLDAPIFRCASLDTPIPFNVELEKNFLAKSKLEKAVEKLLKY